MQESFLSVFIICTFGRMVLRLPYITFSEEKYPMPRGSTAWGLQMFNVDVSMFVSGCLLSKQPCKKMFSGTSAEVSPFLRSWTDSSGQTALPGYPQQETGFRDQGSKSSEQTVFSRHPQQDACTCNVGCAEDREGAGSGAAGGG